MKFFSDKRGSVTPLFAIVLSAVILLDFTMFDALKIKLLKKQADSMAELSVQSVLSLYDKDIQEQYGLYVLKEDEREILESRLYELLKPE